MPTPIDRAVSQKVSKAEQKDKDASKPTVDQGPFFAFAAIVTGVAAWSIWGNDLFPSSDPKGDPETWTHEQCTTWLKNRNLHPSALATREQLIERIKSNLQNPNRQ